MNGIGIPWDYLFGRFEIHADGVIGAGEGRRTLEQTPTARNLTLHDRELFGASLDLIDTSVNVGPASLDLYARAELEGHVHFDVSGRKDGCIVDTLLGCFIPGFGKSLIVVAYC